MSEKTLSIAWRKWLIAGCKLALLAAVAWGLHRTVMAAWEQLEARHWSPASLRPGWLAAAAVLYLIGQFFPGWFWRQVIARLGPRPRLGEALRAYYIGHLGKYVPGKATVILIRAALIRGSGASATAATVAVFYETLSTLAVGAGVAALILLVRFTSHDWLILSALGLAAIVGGPTLPPVFRRLVRLTGVGRLNPSVAEEADRLGYCTLGLAWLTLPGAWVFMGASLWATLAAGGYGSLLGVVDQLLICIAASAIATVAGFLSFLPGGLGVRDAALFELLIPWFGTEGAFVSAILSRLVLLVAELAISGILYPLQLKRFRGIG
ncbi:MAG TPA: lysylphosphatidylglycerol synthase domain-containing protein [Pirellulales bacterium]|nr:lysylphosphatidylglycerol synthase domain-containing protein [Pirellulales bacterium]